jgi:2-keto-3-deoxygluconate permease
MHVPILKSLQKIPAGLMVVPLLLGAALNTFCPSALEIGSFTTALFSNEGQATVVGMQIFFVGTNLRFDRVGEALRRGGVLLLAKWAAGAILGLLIGTFFGKAGVLGVSVLAIISSVTGANGSLYLSLMGEYGDPEDTAAQSVMNIHDGPFLALLTLGASGMANIPFLSLLAAIVPLIVGCILGNLDEDMRKFFSVGAGLVVPFVGFCIGAGINFGSVIEAGPSGLVLTCMVFFIGGGAALLADKFILKRPGYAGAAIASAAGNTIASPAAVALIDPSWEPYVASATTQIAAAVVITAIIVPPIVDKVAKKWGCPKLTAEKTV